MAAQLSFRTNQHEVRLSGETAPFEASFGSRKIHDGVEIVTLRLRSPTPSVPKELRLEWRQPMVDVHAMWTPGAERNRGLVPSWAPGFKSQVTSHAPVVCLHNLEGRNRLTFAASDSLHAIENRCGLHEESAQMLCELRLFAAPMQPITQYEIDIRLDTRDVHYHEVLKDVSDWWAGLPGMAPSPAPTEAKMPMYSTWYCMHENLVVDEVEKQCRLAKQLGCETVIEDAGWQSAEAGGFGFAGDWEPKRIRQMREHVRRVHEMGMKFVLWYSLSHAGYFTETYKRFKDRMLYDFAPHKASILDPRFPEVREHLIGAMERGVREWDIDGLKLDFVDMFMEPAAGAPVHDAAGRDYASVAEAVDRLMADAMARLRAIKPDVMIELRQSYVGPSMRRYGNMFRAHDCPHAATANRLRVLDVRLLAGSTAVHSDPIMWNLAEPVESAALQMIQPLFGVPQVSMLLDRLPEPHLEMVRFWLGFWRENCDVLMEGQLRPMYPHANFPVVAASNNDKMVVAVYEPWVVRPGQLSVPAELVVVNGTQSDRIVFDLKKGIGQRHVRVFDCRGRQLAEEAARMDEGLYALPVPPSGMVRLTRR